MFGISLEEVKVLRDKYQEGLRVKLISMQNDPRPIQAGELGTVRKVDDAGTIHVLWDSGRVLGLVPGEDEFELFDE